MLDLVFSYKWEPVPIHQIRMNMRKLFLMFRAKQMAVAKLKVTKQELNIKMEEAVEKADFLQVKIKLNMSKLLGSTF